MFHTPTFLHGFLYTFHGVSLMVIEHKKGV